MGFLEIYTLWFSARVRLAITIQMIFCIYFPLFSVCLHFDNIHCVFLSLFLFSVTICNQFNFYWSQCKPCASAVMFIWSFYYESLLFNCNPFYFHYLFCKMISISRPFLIPSPDKLATKGNLCPIKKIQDRNIDTNNNTWRSINLGSQGGIS